MNFLVTVDYPILNDNGTLCDEHNHKIGLTELKSKHKLTRKEYDKGTNKKIIIADISEEDSALRIMLSSKTGLYKGDKRQFTFTIDKINKENIKVYLEIPSIYDTYFGEYLAKVMGEVFDENIKRMYDMIDKITKYADANIVEAELKKEVLHSFFKMVEAYERLEDGEPADIYHCEESYIGDELPRRLDRIIEREIIKATKF